MLIIPNYFVKAGRNTKIKAEYMNCELVYIKC